MLYQWSFNHNINLAIIYSSQIQREKREKMKKFIIQKNSMKNKSQAELREKYL